MLIKKSQLARLCGVKPPSISGLIEKGTLIVSDGLIDVSDPANLVYLTKHNAAAASEFQRTGTIEAIVKPDATPKLDTHQAMTKKLAAVHAEEKPTHANPLEDFNPFASLSPSRPPRRPVQPPEPSDDDENETGLTAAEVAETLRKPLYDAKKAKLAAEREAINIDILHKTLGEREYFEAMILELWQSMQRNYIDVAPKQAALICKRLGMVGHELEVVEVLEGDIKKRQDNVAHEVKAVLEGRLTMKVIDDEVEE